MKKWYRLKWTSSDEAHTMQDAMESPVTGAPGRAHHPQGCAQLLDASPNMQSFGFKRIAKTISKSCVRVMKRLVYIPAPDARMLLASE